jgi:hypothetical protein
MKETKKNDRQKEMQKTVFPNWEEIVYQKIKELCHLNGQNHIEYLRRFLEKSEKIKQIGFGNHIAQTMQLAVDAEALHQPRLSKIEETHFEKQNYEINEFFSIFELNIGEFIMVDKRVEDIIGIDAYNFTIANMFALNPNFCLFHPNDVSHVIRWAGIAYAVLDFPGIEIIPDREYYKVCFRINTESSKLNHIKEKKFVLLEKKCFLKVNSEDPNFKFPRYHFDKWNVFPAENFEFVQPTFVSNNNQSTILNCLSYLLNAAILDIAPKYLLMLHERKKFDRNKEIANSINEKIKLYTNQEFEFSENQIADYFSKTIRSKIKNMSLKWDKIGTYGEVVSEQQSITIAQQFGLLPIPPEIVEIIYRSISFE